MKLDNQQLIEEFYNQEKDNYPDITLEQFKDICFGPWRFLKDEMESGKLPEVRFKYFGTFQVYQGRAKNMLQNLKKRFEFKKIGSEQYFKLKNILENYLNEKENSN